MILDAVETVAELAPELLPEGEASVALLRTATPLVLLFGSSSRTPICVLQFGEREPLERIYGVLSRLHPLVPDLVPEPLLCASRGRHQHVLVQRALRGRPWFSLQRRLKNRADWERVLEKSALALERLHQAVRQVRGWTSTVNPAAELREVASRLAVSGVGLPPDTAETVEALALELESLGEIEGLSQHGDYCLNNVMVREDGVGILDFEDFGETSMPLHDQIGLALSVSELGAAAGAPERADALAAAVRQGGEPLGGRLPRGLILHYLLWRVEKAHGSEARAAKKAALLGQIGDFIADPASFWPGDWRTGAGAGDTHARKSE